MNAKEKQSEFIADYLKIKLKEYGYHTSGNTWWLEKYKFFIVIDLQNSQWNSKDKVSFCLNIGPALTATLRDPRKKKASYFDISVNLREGAYLSESRCKQPYHDGSLGYLITNSTEMAEFTKEFAYDLETEILPKLTGLESLEDWVRFLSDLPFWKEQLQRMIQETE